MKEDLVSVIGSLYLLLVKQGQGMDYVLERLKHDVGQLESCDSTTVFDEFTKLHGPALKMTLIDVKYEVDPSLTSFRYRLMRTLKDAGKRAVQVMTFASNTLSHPLQQLALFLQAAAG